MCCNRSSPGAKEVHHHDRVFALATVVAVGVPDDMSREGRDSERENAAVVSSWLHTHGVSGWRGCISKTGGGVDHIPRRRDASAAHEDLVELGLIIQLGIVRLDGL